MSVTTWKTTTPSLMSKITDFILCRRKKPVLEGDPDPELDKGIGSGQTAHEAVEMYNLKKRGSFDGDAISVKSLLGKKGEESDLKKEAARIKKKKKEKELKNKAKIAELEKERTRSEEQDDDWLYTPYQANSDNEPEGEKKKPKPEKVDDLLAAYEGTAEDDEVTIPESAEQLYKLELAKKDNEGSRASKGKSDKNNEKEDDNIRITSKELKKYKYARMYAEEEKKKRAEKKEKKKSLGSDSSDSDAEFQDLMRAVNEQAAG